MPAQQQRPIARAHCCAVLCRADLPCTLCADRDIAEGEEVLHTYGDLSDAQLLQTYGFVEAWGPGEGNPHNVAFIPSDDLVAACQVCVRVLLGRRLGVCQPARCAWGCGGSRLGVCGLGGWAGSFVGVGVEGGAWYEGAG